MLYDKNSIKFKLDIKDMLYCAKYNQLLSSVQKDISLFTRKHLSNLSC